MNQKYNSCLLTNDVETTSIWHNSLRDSTGKKVFEEGMPLLLDLYAKYKIQSTFFFTGYIAKLYPGIVKMITKYGHEVASHGMSHIKNDGFDVMPLERQIKHLKEWEVKNPNYLKDNKLLNQWQQLVHEIMGPSDDNTREKDKELIIKKLGKTVKVKDNLVIKND